MCMYSCYASEEDFFYKLYMSLRISGKNTSMLTKKHVHAIITHWLILTFLLKSLSEIIILVLVLRVLIS